MPYQCALCGQIHEDLPDIAFDRPYYVQGLSEAEQTARTVLTADTCTLDDEHFFIRGVLEIPIHDYPESFGFGVWVSQKAEHFSTYVNHLDSAEIGPYFGWLSTEISFYEEATLTLKTMAHFRGRNRRPSIVVEPTAHPLAVDQNQGISLERAWQIVHFYLDR